MDRIPLKAQERELLGKKVKQLRRQGFLPGNVYGNTKENETVTIKLLDFLPVLKQAGETGLIDLRIGAEKVRPVMIRDVQLDPVKGTPVHVDFFQVNLSEKVTVPVPVTLIGEEPESIKAGETVVLQTINELQVEALPTDLIESFEVDISGLQNVDDVITVGQLVYDRSKLMVLAEEGEILVKLAPAVTEEMQALLAEQEAEAQAATSEAAAAEGATEAEAGAQGETEAGAVGESFQEQTES